jgi:copper(I)-binding protein
MFESDHQMNRIAFILVAVISIIGAPSLAQEYMMGPIKIAHPWARATPQGASVGAGYLKITNLGATADRFIGGTTDVSERLEIHQMSMGNGVMKMREQATGLEIKPGETVEFEPSGYHLMFVGLKKQLMQGEHVNATLKFEKAGTVSVEFNVAPIGAHSPEKAEREMMMPGMADHQKQ